MFNLSVCYTMMERKTEAIRILEKMHEVHGATVGWHCARSPFATAAAATKSAIFVCP